MDQCFAVNPKDTPAAGNEVLDLFPESGRFIVGGWLYCMSGTQSSRGQKAHGLAFALQVAALAAGNICIPEVLQWSTNQGAMVFFVCLPAAMRAGYPTTVFPRAYSHYLKRWQTDELTSFLTRVSVYWRSSGRALPDLVLKPLGSSSKKRKARESVDQPLPLVSSSNLPTPPAAATSQVVEQSFDPQACYIDALPLESPAADYPDFPDISDILDQLDFAVAPTVLSSQLLIPFEGNVLRAVSDTLISDS